MTEIDSINIVSSQAVFEVSSFQTDAHSKSSTLVVNSHVDSRLFKPHPVTRRHARYGFLFGRHDINYDNPDLVIDWIHFWAVWMPQAWQNKI